MGSKTKDWNKRCSESSYHLGNYKGFRSSELCTRNLGQVSLPLSLSLSPSLSLSIYIYMYVYLLYLCFGTTLMLGKIEDKRRRGQQGMRRLDSITDSMDRNLSKL